MEDLNYLSNSVLGGAVGFEDLRATVMAWGSGA